jgi:hypothetical protein
VISRWHEPRRISPERPDTNAVFYSAHKYYPLQEKICFPIG